MVEQHYRWDFIGLSTDTKPTPETSEKVVDGSTFYCSDTSKLYVYCTDDWYERKPLGGGGGGTTYTAGDGIDITDDTISVDTDTIQEKLTAGTGIDITNNTISATGDDTVYSSKTTSNSATGGAVYIGNLGTDQTEVADPSPNDNHYKYFWALPSSNNGSTYGQPGDGTVNIMGSAKGAGSVTIGLNAGSGSYGALNMVAIGSGANSGTNGVAIGYESGSTQDFTGNVCIGDTAKVSVQGVKNAIALGRYAFPTRTGELNIGTGSHPTEGFNSTNYRVIGGVHDPVDAHDAATKGYVDAHAGGGVTTYYISPTDYNDITGGQTTITLYKESALTNSANGGEIYDALMSGSVRFATVDTQSSFQRYHNVFTFDLPLANTDAEWSNHGTVNIEASGMLAAPFSRLTIDISGRTSSTITAFLGE